MTINNLLCKYSSDRLNSITDQLETLYQTKLELETKKNSVKKDLTYSDNKLFELKQQLIELQSQLSDSKFQHQELTELQLYLTKLRTQFSIATELHQKLKIKLETLNSDLLDNQLKIESLRQDLKSLQESEETFSTATPFEHLSLEASSVAQLVQKYSSIK